MQHILPFPNRPRRLASIGVLVSLLLGALAASPRPAGPAAVINASAPLGTVTMVQVTIDNSGAPAVTAGLYEAWPPPAVARPSAGAPEPLRVPLPDDPGPITSGLIAQLAAASDGQADMLVYLADQADLSAAAALGDWNARGAAVVDALQQHALASQAPLLAALQNAGVAARSFWIVNAVAVHGDTGLAHWLADQPAVALVAANVPHPLDDEPSAASRPGIAEPAWGVSQIGAPSVWADWGVRGAGITVASLDTGVAYTHTALLEQYRGWSAGGVDHNYNWYDPAGDPPSPVPLDQAGHGTHTMGTMVGGAAGGYSALGVAPGARWIAVRACEGFFCTDTALFSGAQWLLAPTNLAGGAPRPDLRPNVINNSWGKSGEDDWYSGYVTAWNAAGIFSVFANGNYGGFDACQSSTSPGNYANSFAAGATDSQDEIAPFSSRGPTSDGRLKPEVSAPGVAVPSAAPDGSVRLLSGTSMAAPHVAGVVALLWSANPTLIGDLAATEYVLTSTAVPRPSAECSGNAGPPSVPNNVYGWGRVDARQAVQQARVDVPWLSVQPSVVLPAGGSALVDVTLDARQVSGIGTYEARVLVVRGGNLSSIPVTFEVQAAADTAPITGRLSDRWHGAGVYGRVQVGAGPAMQTDAGGNYTVTLAYGDYALTASATGYISDTADVSVTAPITASFILTPDLPHIQWSSGPISATLAFAEQFSAPILLSNLGTRPLTVTAEIPPLDWIVDGAGLPGASLYDLSAFAPISLTDDSIYTEPLTLGFDLPIFGQMTGQLYLSSNGWVSVRQPTSANAFASCLPGTTLPPGALAPFWADLDPSQGGSVRFGLVAPGIFVVGFEAVPPWRETPDPAGPAYTFQLVLHAGGEVEYLYGDMDELPARWSVGASYDGERGLRLACHSDPAELTGKQWSIHNQPLPGPWLSAEPATLTLAAGGSANIYAVLSGFGYAAWHPGPSSGILRLRTNDPGQATGDVPASAQVGPAPYQTILVLILR